MPLSPRHTTGGAPALDAARHTAIRRPGRRSLILFIAMVLVLPLLASRALADDEPSTNFIPHDLRNVTMCIDNNSVDVHLDGTTQVRHPQASQLAPGISQAIAASLQSLGPSAFTRRGSCSGSDSYLAVDIRILALDPTVYRHYGSNAYNVSIWVQVGNYVPRRDTANPALHKVDFDGFDEQIISAPLNGVLTQRALAACRSKLVDLVAAYRVDNPGSRSDQIQNLAQAADGAKEVYVSLQGGDYGRARSTWQPVDKVIHSILPTLEQRAPSLADDMDYAMSLVELGFLHQNWSEAQKGASTLPELLTQAQAAWNASP